MSMKCNVTVTGMRGDEIKANVGEALNRAIGSFGRQVLLPRSQQLVPVDEGKLKASGRFSLKDKDHTGRLIYGGFGARHAHLVEFGTIHTKEQSFMRRAGEQTKSQLYPMIRSEQERKVR